MSLTLLVNIKSPRNGNEVFVMPLEINARDEKYWRDAWVAYGWDKNAVVNAQISILNLSPDLSDKDRLHD